MPAGENTEIGKRGFQSTSVPALAPTASPSATKPKVDKPLTPIECKRIYDEASAAGKKAGDSAYVRPMVVSDTDTKQTYFIEDGVCGFAEVHIETARGAFVKWCKENDLGWKAYRGGYDLQIDGGYNQSMQRKEAFCAAFAQVLNSYGIDAWMTSRMD